MTLLARRHLLVAMDVLVSTASEIRPEAEPVLPDSSSLFVTSFQAIDLAS